MMAVRDKLEKKIKEKEAELWQLKSQVRHAEAFIEGLREALALLPKETADDIPVALRPGTNVDKARSALLAKGSPMHISDLLKALGKSDDNDSRAALSGSISAYYRRGQIFTRPAPNTFGLIEFSSATEKPKAVNGPPVNFGRDQSEPKSDDPWDLETEDTTSEDAIEIDMPF